MKSKLVKYPYKDGKRYRWDTYKMGKKFEYTWEQSEPNNYETITPYIKAEQYNPETLVPGEYGLVDITGTDISNNIINSIGGINHFYK